MLDHILVQRKKKAQEAFNEILLETIKDLGTIPVGNLYQSVCGSVSFDTYQRAIGQLVANGQVSEWCNVLTCTGK